MDSQRNVPLFWTFHNNGNESEVALFYVPPCGWTPGEVQVTQLTGADHKGLVKLETAAEREWWVTFESHKSCLGRNEIRNHTIQNQNPLFFLCYSVLGNGRNTIQNVRSHLSHNFPQSPIKNITDCRSFK